MDKEFELLKIKYENTRTWLLTCLAIAVSMSIGYYSIEDIAFRRILGIIMGVLVIALGIFYISQTIKYMNILKYLEKDNLKKDF